MRRSGSLFGIGAVGVLVAACGGGASGQPEPAGTAGATSGATSGGNAKASSVQIAIDKARSLPAGAKFRDLVRLAREMAGKPGGAPCLLQGGKSGGESALGAPVDAGASSLADPPADLDALLMSGVKKKPFSDFGTRIFTPTEHSEGADYLDLMTFTPASRLVSGGQIPVLIATDQGIYPGFPNMVSDGQRLTAESRAQIKELLLPQAKVWIITGEGDAPIERVREALALIAETTGTVVLASPLPKASGPKKRVSRYDFRVDQGQPYACSTRSEPGIEAGPIGSYADGKIFKLGETFNAAVAACTTNGAGGSIHVRMRIDPTGKLVEGCADTDDTGDAEARKCVVEAVRKLSFPAPDKAGFVNFGSAAVLTGKKLQALCDP